MDTLALWHDTLIERLQLKIKQLESRLDNQAKQIDYLLFRLKENENDG